MDKISFYLVLAISFLISDISDSRNYAFTDQVACNQMKLDSHQDTADCNTIAGHCRKTMNERLLASCSENGQQENKISSEFKQISSLFSTGMTSASSGLSMRCKALKTMRSNQLVDCQNSMQLCTKGTSTDSQGRTFNIFATARRGSQKVKITCAQFQGACSQFAQDLDSRIPAAQVAESQLCDQIIRLAADTGGSTAAPRNSVDATNYTAEEIVCHFKPDAEGCPPKK